MENGSQLPGRLEGDDYSFEAEEFQEKDRKVSLPRGVKTTKKIVSNYANSIQEELVSNEFGVDLGRTSMRDLGEVYNDKMWAATRLEDGHPDERSVTYNFGVALGKALDDETGKKPRKEKAVELASRVLDTNGAVGSYHRNQEQLMKKGAMDSEQVVDELNGE
ncbi:MAG: hypothetical protein ABEJ98_03425 [Candidatus Nanohaloarchaea archaeon]